MTPRLRRFPAHFHLFKALVPLLAAALALLPLFAGEEADTAPSKTSELAMRSELQKMAEWDKSTGFKNSIIELPAVFEMPLRDRLPYTESYASIQHRFVKNPQSGDRNPACASARHSREIALGNMRNFPSQVC